MVTPGNNNVRSLPKTIEMAMSRYLQSYETQFQGREIEKKRLLSYAESKIIRLRKKAPKFFQEKLPTLVNQAASALLACDTSTNDGLNKFNDIHCQFLRVLDELKNTQPAGDVNFQDEYDRFKQKELLRVKHLELREKIDRMEAIEFDLDDLGEDEVETLYAKTFAQLDRDKVELKRIATLIAKMEGENIEEEIKFKLKVIPRSTLSKISKEQLNKLESLIETFYLENKRNKKALYVDKSNIDGMIEQLEIDASKFTKEDMNQISKDALDAYRTFFRDIDNAKRNEYFNSLINNHHLKPKEGLIIDDPDDVPDDVREKLDESGRIRDRQLDEFCEEFAKRPCNEEVGGDEVHDEEGGASDDDEIEATYIKSNGYLFSRIKEEPRDDYENDAPSEDEMIVGENAANGLDADMGKQVQSPSSDGSSDDDPSDAPVDESLAEHFSQGASSNGAPSNGDQSVTNEEPDHKRQKCDDSEEEDFQVLGVVEPTDKVDIITIDDDD